MHSGFWKYGFNASNTPKKARRFSTASKRILMALLMSAFSGAVLATDGTFKGPYDDETVQQRDARMAWWREARFGLFIHWGVYAVPAGLE